MLSSTSDSFILSFPRNLKFGIILDLQKVVNLESFFTQLPPKLKPYVVMVHLLKRRSKHWYNTLLRFYQLFY